jgi:hypothetical protein
MADFSRLSDTKRHEDLPRFPADLYGSPDVDEGYQSRPIAEVETKRGTSDPTYLYYTLGKLEIMKLRSDLQKKEGANFSLEKFHDAFMRQGASPIKIMRKALLGDNSPTLYASVASYLFLAIESPGLC